MSEELIPINIVIGDRTYRIRISPEDEEHVRRTIKVINEKIVDYKTHFAGQDMQDYVAMVLIWYATQSTANTSPAVLESNWLQELQQIEQQLDKALASPRE